MALTTAQQVRLGIQDPPRIELHTYYGDGLASAFTLPHQNITSASAMIALANSWTATGASFNSSGMVTFSGVISAQSAFAVNYVYSVFSDDEVDHFITAGGTVKGAQLEAVGALLFDALKRSHWRAANGSEYDDTAAQKLLMDMYSKFKADVASEAILGGYMAGWSENQ